MNVAEDFKELLDDFVQETGRGLQAGTAELAAYAAGRSAHLSTLVGDPGFAVALRAERDAVALKAGITAVRQGDAADQRIVGLIHGGLSFAAKALATA